MKLGEMTLEAAAKAAAGNWKQLSSFSWHRRTDLADAENWCLVYTHHRNSGLIDSSNATVIEKALRPYTCRRRDPDVVAERHSHWLCGWIEGYSIRVFKRDRITAAFAKYHELAERLAEYSLLDENDFVRREREASMENLTIAGIGLRGEYELPEDWTGRVWRWFTGNDPAAIESRDDRGGYPSEDQLRRAFEALHYRPAA